MNPAEDAAWQRGFMTAFVAICLILVIFIVCKKSNSFDIPRMRKEGLGIPRGGREWLTIPRMNK